MSRSKVKDCAISSSEVAVFEGMDVRIVDVEGKKWVVMKDVGTALGYQSDRAFRKLVQELENNGELVEGRHFRFLPLQTAGGAQKTKILSYRGVIRVAMRSDAPKAASFRDYAEVVLYRYMVEGHALISKEDQQKIKSEFVTVDEFDRRIEQIAAALTSAVIKALPAAIPQQTPAEMYQQAINVSRNNFMTPTECAYEIMGGLPPGFNGGGHFDDYCAMRHVEEFGRYPERREPPLFKGNKIREWILPKDVKHKQHVKMWAKEYLKKTANGQTSLKFKPAKPTVNKRGRALGKPRGAV